MSSNTKTIIHKKYSQQLLGAVLAGAMTTVPIVANAYNISDKIDFSIGGYAKLSAIYSDTDSGKLSNTLGRNIYLPSKTPVGADESHKVLDFTARESRLNFKAKNTQGAHKLSMTLEIDFLGTTDGNEVVSNSYPPRLRHFFFTFDNWLFGQTWSTFMDTGALAEAVDFLASPEGIVFIRQAQVRYSGKNFQIALENPESFVTGSTDRDVNTLPDVTANYKLKGHWGHVRFNALVRKIEVDEPTLDTSATGAGIGISGKIKVGASDDIRFSVNYGDGMGRYTSLGMVKDGILISNEIETVKSTAATVAYHHAWNAQSRSNIILSTVDIDNPTGAAATENKSSSSIQLNYLYSPVGHISYGIMILAAQREVENGDDGKLNRVQAVAKYAF